MWYVIWTTTGKEEHCRVMIEKKCDPGTYERCVIPKNSIKKHVKGNWTTTEYKLFPSYLFVKSEKIEAFAQELKKVTGFLQVLQNDEIFLPLSPEEEKFLRKFLETEEVLPESYGVKEGDTVRILAGPLVGLEGLIKFIDRHKRMAVLETELFGRRVEMKMGLEVMSAECITEIIGRASGNSSDGETTPKKWD